MPDARRGAAGRTVARMTTDRQPPRTTLGRLGAWAADHRRLVVIVWGGGRARPRGARAVRGQGALGRRLGGSGLGVRGGSPRDRVAFPRAGNLCAVGGRGRRARRDRRSADARRARRGAAGASRRPGRERSARAPAGRHRLARRPHRDRHRARGRGAVGDGRGGRPARRTASPAVQARRHRSPHRPGRDVVRLQPRQQGRDDEVRGAVVAAHAHAARARVRHAGGGRPAAPAHDGRAARRRRPALRLRAAPRRVHLGDELRDDVRDRARDRLRAVHRGPIPRRARGRPVAARRHGAHDGHGRQGRARERAHRDRRAAGGHARAGSDVPLGAARDRAGRAVGPRGDPDAAARCAVRARPPDQRRSDTPAQRGRPSQRALRRLGPPPVGATAALRRRRGR